MTHEVKDLKGVHYDLVTDQAIHNEGYNLLQINELYFIREPFISV